MLSVAGDGFFSALGVAAVFPVVAIATATAIAAFGIG